MEAWGLHFQELDARSHFNMTLNTSTVREVPWTAENKTRTIIANLQLAQVQTIRTMHLTLGAFSLALTLLTVHRIISDAKRAAAVQVPLRKERFSALRNVHSAETFPLVLACGAVIQQTIFVAVQSTSLRSVLSRQCRGLAMVTFPAIFLMGYITLAFGIEMAMRSMRYHRFEPRGKWNVTICIAAVSVLSLLTWMPTVAWPMYNRCFGSLIWFPVRYELIALIILGILIASFLTLAAVISIQLMRTSNVDPNERIAASRMCYYLLMAALIYILVIPVEVQAHRRDFTNTLATSRIAEIALFTSGMVISFFHLFLRVNATRLVISPMSEMTSRNKPKRPRIRFFGPSDLEMNISGPMALQGGRRPESRQGLINVGPEKNRYDFDPGYFERPNRPLTPASIQSQGAIDPTRWPLPPDSEKTGYFGQEKETSGLHRRNKSNYSLFPTRAEDIPRLPPTVYSPKSEERSRLPSLAMRRQARRSSLDNTKSITDVSEAFGFLSKPAPLFGRNHNRNSSAVSCATVQIGLRFSIAPATLAAAKCTRPERQPELSNLSAPPLRREPTDSSGESLGLPIQSPSTHTSSSEALGEAINALKFPEPPKPTLSPAKPSPGKTPAFPTLSSATYLQTQREKILPPTPRADLPAQSSVPPPAAVAHHPAMSGLRMNPVSPQSPSTPYSSSSSGRSSPARPNARSPTMPSPTARIPLGAGTMARSPPGKGWI